MFDECFDLELNIISAFQLQNLETDQDLGDFVQTNPFVIVMQLVSGSIFGSA